MHFFFCWETTRRCVRCFGSGLGKLFSPRGDTIAACCIFFSCPCLASPYRVPQRIVQLSQATAKLSSEGASTRARAADAEDTMEKIAHDLEVCVMLCCVVLCCSKKYFVFRLLASSKTKKGLHMYVRGSCPYRGLWCHAWCLVSCTGSLSCARMFACSV